MALTSPKPAACGDLFDLPETLVGQIINGRLATHPRLAPRHARAYSLRGVNFGGPFDKGVDGSGGWWIFDKSELHLNGDILVPYPAGGRRSRMPRLPDGLRAD